MSMRYTLKRSLFKNRRHRHILEFWVATPFLCITLTKMKSKPQEPPFLFRLVFTFLHTLLTKIENVTRRTVVDPTRRLASSIRRFVSLSISLSVSFLSLVVLLFILIITSFLFYILLYRNLVPPNLSVSRRLHFDPSTLSASISLLTPRDQWESHVFSSPDSQKSIETSSVMSSSYEYDFFVSVSLYDNQVNRDVPISCKLELSDVDERILARSVRSILLSHRSVLVQYYEDISAFFKYLMFLHNGRDVEVSLLFFFDFTLCTFTTTTTT